MTRSDCEYPARCFVVLHLLGLPDRESIMRHIVIAEKGTDVRSREGYSVANKHDIY